MVTKNAGLETKILEMKAADIPFADSGHNTPTLFVDDIRGVAVLGSVARLNLVENRVDPVTSQFTHKIVAVLAVPLDQIINWGPFLMKHFSKEMLEGALAEMQKRATTEDASDA